jgi:hypothetical protein
MNAGRKEQGSRTKGASLVRVCAIAAAASFAPVSLAQTVTAGKYVGSYVQDTQPPYRNVGVVLTIARVESEKVQGAASVTGGYCPGLWTVEGSADGTKLMLKSIKGPERLGCSFNLDGDVRGDVIQANVEGNRFQLKK